MPQPPLAPGMDGKGGAGAKRVRSRTSEPIETAAHGSVNIGEGRLTRWEEQEKVFQEELFKSHGWRSDLAQRLQTSEVAKQWRSHLFHWCLKWAGSIWGQKFLPPASRQLLTFPPLLMAQIVCSSSGRGRSKERMTPLLLWPGLHKLGVDSD